MDMGPQAPSGEVLSGLSHAHPEAGPPATAGLGEGGVDPPNRLKGRSLGRGLEGSRA